MATDVSTASRLRTVWASRRTLHLLVARDLKVKYSDSVLGYLWTVLEPLMMAGVYWFVFTKIFKRSVGEEPYIIFLLCAMLPWQWTNGGIRSSLRALVKDAKLVRSTSVPREIWVLRVIGAKFMEFAFSVPVIALFAVLSSASLSWYVVFVPLAVLLQAAFLIGCGLVMAPLAVMFSDVERMIRIVMRLAFFCSPVIYGLNDVEERLGKPLSTIYVLNPMAGILDLYRAAFFPDQWAGWGVVGVAAAGSALIFAFGVWVFSRLEGPVLKEM